MSWGPLSSIVIIVILSQFDQSIGRTWYVLYSYGNPFLKSGMHILGWRGKQTSKYLAKNCQILDWKYLEIFGKKLSDIGLETHFSLFWIILTWSYLKSELTLKIGNLVNLCVFFCYFAFASNFAARFLCVKIWHNLEWSLTDILKSSNQIY